MVILEALQSALVSLLIVYLGFVNTLAQSIELKLGIPPVENAPEIAIVLPSKPSDEITLLSRIYATASGVSKILFENEAFQEAARGVHGEAITLEAINSGNVEEMTLKTLVNIFCEYSTDTYTRTTTGTGFFIHENGVILTNAHVAQFLLLEGTDEKVKDTECVIRSGDPALARYRAELLFISPTWILNNAKLISAEHPQGTGEYDYALLYVADTLDGTPLPRSFDALPIHTEFLSTDLTGASVVTGGYPAEKLLTEGTRAELSPETAGTSIQELYTFGSTYADIFSVTESTVGEYGASGGPVVDPSRGAIGLVVTKGDLRTEGAKSLRALTLSYIDRTIVEETGFSLLENAGGDLVRRGDIFKEALAPFLTRLLSYELEA